MIKNMKPCFLAAELSKEKSTNMMVNGTEIKIKPHEELMMNV